MKALFILAAVFAVVLAQGPNYGSYVAVCSSDSTAVVFMNYDQQNCTGTLSNYSKPVGVCEVEFVVASWNALCNATNIWYNNFLGTTCSGSSILTRTYPTFQCKNCPNAECKS